MELRQLECFYMVSKFCNFTKAADELHVSQPAITKAIRGLEDELNVRLFVRNQKRVMLTREGYTFLSQTERILSSVKEALSEMNQFQDGHSGVITLGVPPMIGACLFPDILAKFKQLHPFVDFKVLEGGSLDVISSIEAGELDLAIVILPENQRTLQSLSLTTDEYVLCVHPDSPLTRHKTISFDHLKNEPFILLNPGNYQHQIITQRCLSHHYSPHIILTSNHYKTINGLVARGVGISFLLRMVAEEDPRMAAIPLEEPIQCNISLVWKDIKYLSQASRSFIKFIKEYRNHRVCMPGDPRFGSTIQHENAANR